MIVDTSALLSLVFGETQAIAVFDALSMPGAKRISAANLLEAYCVIDRRNDHDATRLLEECIERFELIVEPVVIEHVGIARSAWTRFGKGSGHPAGLNYGDCFAYAIAVAFDEPLLFVGNDFIHTDVLPALR